MNNKALWARASSLLYYDANSGVLTWIGGRESGKAAGWLHNRGYRAVSIDGRNYLAHRIAWLLQTGAMPTGFIDHINGDKADNRLANLREVDGSGNAQNKRRARRDSTTGVMGVRPMRSKWQARIMVAGKEHHIGTFPTQELAAAAYIQAKRELHPKGTL